MEPSTKNCELVPTLVVIFLIRSEKSDRKAIGAGVGVKIEKILDGQLPCELEKTDDFYGGAVGVCSLHEGGVAIGGI